MDHDSRKVLDTQLPLLEGQHVRAEYTDEYKEKVFWIWYRAGKLSGEKLHGLIEPDEFGILPSSKVLGGWVTHNFRPRSVDVDAQVEKGIQERVVTEKIEMLTRHTQVGKEMQEISIRYLREHESELKPHTALRMLVEGIEIERKSRGLPSMIAKLVDATDESVMKEIDDILNAIDRDALDVIDVESEEVTENTVSDLQ